MQCVIIAAGKGTRMRPLTDTLAKPLISVCGKPILDHIVGALPEAVDELILVVGYRQEQIRSHCGEEFYGRAVRYVEQENFAGGTGDALMQTKEYVTGKFMFMYADDIHGAAALQAAAREDSAMLAMTSDTPERFGVVVQNEDGTLREIIEKPQDPPSNLVNISGFVLQPSVFEYEVPVSEEHGEHLATDIISAYAADHPVKIIEQDLWLPIGYPEHIAAAEQVLCPDCVESDD